MLLNSIDFAIFLLNGVGIFYSKLVEILLSNEGGGSALLIGSRGDVVEKK